MAEKRNYKKDTVAPIAADAHGKLPPQALDLEEAILGAIMLETEAFPMISEIVRPECFYKIAHQKIFRAVASLSYRSEPTDMLMVVEELKKTGELDDVGGAYAIVLLVNKISSAANIEFHARIIAQKYIAREIIRVASHVQTRAYDESTDVDDLMKEAELLLGNVDDFVYANQGLSHITASLDKAQEAFELRIDQTSKGLSTGINTGLAKFNKTLGGGWQPSTLNIIAARPAMGKTALLLHFAKAAAMCDIPVCIYSLEMSSVSLTNRLILAEAYQDENTQIKADRFRLGYCNEKEWALFEAAKRRLAELPIYIDDQPMVDARYIGTHTKRMKKAGKCGMVLIDYLQLADMSDPSGNKSRNREQEVSQTTRSFKIIAKVLDAPVILLSQLNRGVEGRPDKKPLMSDLRESGAIEQDADTVTFIYRPAYYKITETEDGKSTENLGYLLLAKQRDGASNEEIAFTHNPSMTKVWDYYEGDEPFDADPTVFAGIEEDEVPF